MRTKKTKEHISKLAKKYNLPVSTVEEIVETPFRFTAEVMKEGNPKTMDFGQVRLMKWGVFKVKEGRKKFFKRLNDEKKSNNS